MSEPILAELERLRRKEQTTFRCEHVGALPSDCAVCVERRRVRQLYALLHEAARHLPTREPIGGPRNQRICSMCRVTCGAEETLQHRPHCLSERIEKVLSDLRGLS